MNLTQLNVETSKVKKERYLIRQDNTIYQCSIKKKKIKYRTRQIKATETNDVSYLS